MKAIWNGNVIAESNDTVVIDGHSFPADSVRNEFIRGSNTKTVCHWKDAAFYYDLQVDGETNADAAWYYQEPSEQAKVIKVRIAFWRGVEIVKGNS